MSSYFSNIPQVTYQGPGSKEPFAFINLATKYFLNTMVI